MRRADAAYELHAEDTEFRNAPEPPPSTFALLPPRPWSETPQPAPPPTRVWEAVQLTRPAPSLEALSAEDEHDELDVPAYLRKKNSDMG